MAFTAEFCAYAAAHGRDPEAQIHADRAAWPGGVMTGFILWCDRLLFVFRREHPEAFIGPHVATLGLSQLNPVNEQIKQRMAALFGAGYDYTYLYPGVQKVVQAAGRVIRTQSDQGTLFLIDDRFAEHKVQQLLPTWWQLG